MNNLLHKDIYLIRHGQTDWNQQGKIQGHTDIPLNSEGQKQALQLKEKLAGIIFTKVFSSDLLRAYQTALLVLNSHASNIIQIPALRERTVGIWEGRSINDLKEHLANHPTLEHATQEEFMAYRLDESIENYNEVYERLQNFISSIALASINGPILLASHGSVLRALLYKFDFKPGLRWDLKNTAYIKLGVSTAGHLSIVESDGIKLVPAQEVRFPI